MSTAVLSPPPAPFVPRPPRWTCDQYHRLWDSGALEGRSVILVDGEMLEMAAPSPRHDVALAYCQHWLQQVFPWGSFWVRPQMGMVFNINTDPSPDLAIVVGPPEQYTRHPTTAVLVVEVADSSLAFDTGDKASLYAAAGILDYWVIDVVNRRVLVFRDPRPDAAQKYGHGYTTLTAHGPADAVAPLAAPAASVLAGELLPATP